MTVLASPVDLQPAAVPGRRPDLRPIRDGDRQGGPDGGPDGGRPSDRTGDRPGDSPGDDTELTVRVLHHLLDEAAAVWPDACAVRDPGGGWNYAELVALSHAVASWLHDRGVRRGDRVLVRLPGTRHVLSLLFGLSRLGAVLVPINPAMKPYHLRSVVADCAPVLAIVDGAGAASGASQGPANGSGNGPSNGSATQSADRPANGSTNASADVVADGLAEGLECVPNLRLTRLWPQVEVLRLAGARIDGEHASPEDLAALIYTSGSTAAPKAVMLPHSQMAFATQAIQAMLGYRPTDVVFCGVPLSFDYGLYQILLSALAGAELVLAGDEPKFRLLEELRAARATVFPAVPSLAAALSRLLDRDPGPTRLRMITNTGAALDGAIIDQLRAALPGTRVVRMYGTTECKRITIMPPERDGDRPQSVGLPLPGTQVRIVDADGAALPPCHVGEIVVTGPHVMPGYLNQPELTARTFRRTAGGEVRLHTGDYGWLDEDGYLYFQGRRDDLFKRRGARMSCIEIEAAAMDVPGVTAAAVLPPDGDRDLAIFVATDLPATTVLRQLAQRLEPAKVPAICRVLPAMPLTPNGKSAKDVLRALLANGA